MTLRSCSVCLSYHQRLLSLVLLSISAPVVLSGVPIHTVVPVECGNYFTWQSLGIFYSHRKVGQAGKITRVACCNDQEKEQFRDILHIVPTHVAPSYTVHPRTGDVYSAYNKPLAVLDFLTNNKVEEEYILVIDADMIFVQRFNPVEMGVRQGWAVSAFFSYMKGVNNELALKHVPEVLPRNDTLAGPMGRRGDMCGGFTFMMRDDLARTAPLWLKYTEDVRFDDDAWRLSGDQYAIHPGDKPWISEMYGYAYGAAKADVWHIAARTAMEYPEYELVGNLVAEPPMVMHYGLEFSIPNTGYSFDKHWFYGFDALKCPPWNLDPKVRSMGGLFNHPPMPSELKTKGLALMRDLYGILTVNTLNEAFCERHYLKCPVTEELEKECAKVHLISEQVNQGLAYLEKDGIGGCEDGDPRCSIWAKGGECENNPYYMAGACRKSCHHCNARPLNTHLDDFRHAAWEQRFMKDMPGTTQVQPATPIDTTVKPVDSEAQQGQADAGQQGQQQVKSNDAAEDVQKAGDGAKVKEVKKAVTQLLINDAAQQQHQEDGQGDGTTVDTSQQQEGQGGGSAGQQGAASDEAAGADTTDTGDQDAEPEGQVIDGVTAAVKGSGDADSAGHEDSTAGDADAGNADALTGNDADDARSGQQAQQQQQVLKAEKQPVHVPAKQETQDSDTIGQGGDQQGAAGQEQGSAGGEQQDTAAAVVRPKEQEVVADEVPKQEKVTHEAPPLELDAAQAEQRNKARKTMENQPQVLHPAAQQLADSCHALKNVLTVLQLQDCLDAAHKGVEYHQPTLRTPSSTAETTIHQLHETDPALTHKQGLVQHAAGGVGFMIWCGLGLLIFMLRPKISSKLVGGVKQRRAAPAVARRLPL